MVVVPAVTPVTEPAVPTVATAVLLDDQAPPDTASVRVMLPAGQTVAEPDMLPADGVALTETVLVADAVPHPVVTV